MDEQHPKKYPVILAKDHVMAKHLASMGISTNTNTTTTTTSREETQQEGVKEEL